MDSTVSMCGRLGTSVETRIDRNGKEYAKFRMASSHSYMRDGQWVESPPTWVSVRCFRQLGANVGFSLSKGQPVVVVGRLRVEEWTSKSGVVRERAVLDAMAVGHDLNWGVSRFGKLEKDRLEPTATLAPPEPEEDEDPYAGVEDELDDLDDADFEFAMNAHEGEENQVQVPVAG